MFDMLRIKWKEFALRRQVPPAKAFTGCPRNKLLSPQHEFATSVWWAQKTPKIVQHWRRCQSARGIWQCQSKFMRCMEVYKNGARGAVSTASVMRSPFTPDAAWSVLACRRCKRGEIQLLQHSAHQQSVKLHYPTNSFTISERRACKNPGRKYLEEVDCFIKPPLRNLLLIPEVVHHRGDRKHEAGLQDAK